MDSVKLSHWKKKAALRIQDGMMIRIGGFEVVRNPQSRDTSVR